MKLYLVHCGFYDNEVCDGLYESHINLFVAADSFEDAKIKVKQNDVFKNKRMHVDGLQEVQSVDGYSISLQQDVSLNGATRVISNKHRDLAPKPTATT